MEALQHIGLPGIYELDRGMTVSVQPRDERFCPDICRHVDPDRLSPGLVRDDPILENPRSAIGPAAEGKHGLGLVAPQQLAFGAEAEQHLTRVIGKRVATLKVDDGKNFFASISVEIVEAGPIDRLIGDAVAVQIEIANLSLIDQRLWKAVFPQLVMVFVPGLQRGRRKSNPDWLRVPSV